jgi:hypothetical protein
MDRLLASMLPQRASSPNHRAIGTGIYPLFHAGTNCDLNRLTHPPATLREARPTPATRSTWTAWIAYGLASLLHRP